MFWGFKRKKYKEIMKENTVAKLKRQFTKVYCGDCIHFRKVKNTWYYLAGNGGQMSNEYNRYCDHPINNVDYDECYDTFEERVCYKKNNRQSPEVLNYGNKCHLFEKSDTTPDWEK